MPATDDVRQRQKLDDLVDGIRERHADRLRRVAADIRGGLDPYHDDHGEPQDSEVDDDLVAHEQADELGEDGAQPVH